MKMLLTAALLLALAGAARADDPAKATPAEKARKTETARERGAKEKPKEKRGDAPAATPPAKAPEKAPDAKGEKPCEPVKPCPID